MHRTEMVLLVVGLAAAFTPFFTNLAHGWLRDHESGFCSIVSAATSELLSDVMLAECEPFVANLAQITISLSRQKVG